MNLQEDLPVISCRAKTGNQERVTNINAFLPTHTEAEYNVGLCYSKDNHTKASLGEISTKTAKHKVFLCSVSFQRFLL